MSVTSDWVITICGNEISVLFSKTGSLMLRSSIVDIQQSNHLKSLLCLDLGKNKYHQHC